MNRDNHRIACFLLAVEDRKTKNVVGVYQVNVSCWTGLESYALPLLVVLAMRRLLSANDIRMSTTPCT